MAIESYGASMKDQDRRFITRSPENSETPIESFRNWITPNEQFYVRNHFDDPELDDSEWALHVFGCIDPVSRYSKDDLYRLPQTNLVATLECAGNGRSYLNGDVPGVQWGAGAVGNAEWSGVPLRLLLEPARISDDAVEVVFEGSDTGVDAEAGGMVRFARSLPLDMALHPDTIVALRMNGEVLAKEHGYPARLVVPGWYGVASVKWLRGIRLVSEPFRGFFQTTKYTVMRKSARGLSEDVVGMMLPKSEITHPHQGACLALETRLVEGVAWAGPDAVAAVEFSSDGGNSWRRAELTSVQCRYTWTHWRIEWEPPAPGAYRLMARTISSSGEIQPSRHNPLHGGYHINFSRPLEISVTERQTTKRLVFAI